MRDRAIRNVHPNICTIRSGIEAWDYDGNVVSLDESKIDTEIIRLQAEWDAQEYARSRQAEYPSVGDQLDMLMKDMKNNTTTHQESCEAVKAKYPK